MNEYFLRCNTSDICGKFVTAILVQRRSLGVVGCVHTTSAGRKGYLVTLFHLDDWANNSRGLRQLCRSWNSPQLLNHGEDFLRFNAAMIATGEGQRSTRACYKGLGPL